MLVKRGIQFNRELPPGRKRFECHRPAERGRNSGIFGLGRRRVFRMVDRVKMENSSWRWAIWLGLMWLTAAGSFPSARAEEAAGPENGRLKREPVVRHVDRTRDRDDLKRIWFYRKKLPEPFYRRNNFGWAYAEIDGLDKKEYFAHSGIQDFDGMSKTAARRLRGISFSPEKGKGQFKTLFVDYRGVVDSPDALPRCFDTEYKMIEDIASRLPDTSVAGRIRLYTNLEPCPSCLGVMEQFLAIYTNVQMDVMYEWPP